MTTDPSQPALEELSLASQNSLSQSRDDDDTFLCRIDKSHLLQAFLQHLQFKKNQTTIVNVCVKTVRFVIEDSRVWQASLSLGEQIFSEFKASDTVQPFKVPLSVLLDCLNVYGPSSNSMLLMDYRGYGQPLKITLTGDECVTEINLRTFDCDDLVYFSTDFRRFDIYNKVILQAHILKESLSELDWSNENLTILMSPDFFKFSTEGASGSCHIQFPRDSPAFVEFDCRSTQIFTYKLQHLQPALKASGNLATQTQIRMNERGMLCMQHMLSVPDGKKTCFVDFYLLPSEDEL